MTAGILIAWSLALAVVIMLALLAMATRRRDMGWVDVGWTTAVGASVLLFALAGPGVPWRRAAVCALALVWSSRLVWHVLAHRVVIAGRREDTRYQALREHWGSRARLYVPLLFLAEAPLATLFALPMLIAMRQPSTGFTAWDVIGLAVGCVAIVGESLADRQLERFRVQPTNRGKTCRAGLWRVSRHPNYLFEWLHWWAYALLAIGAPYAWVTLLGPLLMLLFIFRVTGIPHTERQALRSRGDDYRRYQAATSIFIPWFPRREECV